METKLFCSHVNPDCERSRSPYGWSPRKVCQSPATSSQSAEIVEDDEIVHFSWHSAELLDRRYEIESLSGDGTFGRVVIAKDNLQNRKVAIKIIRDVKRYTENAKIEAEILQHIRKADPTGCSRCAMLYDTFTHDSRYFCLVFEPLGTSLYNFLENNYFRGFWVQDIQVFAKQTLKALHFLHRELKLTHTDLKPENILLQNMSCPREARFPREQLWLESRRAQQHQTVPPYLRPASADIKIIDFGNATYEHEHHSTIINTRQYRAPEVVLEVGWDERSDIWSAGCIFIELYTSELLFGTHDNLEHLALMEKILGKLPIHLLESTGQAIQTKYLKKLPAGPCVVGCPEELTWGVNWPDGSASFASESHVASQLPLAKRVQPEHSLLADFVSHLLTHDPHRRPATSEALRHAFFLEHYDD